MKSRLFVLLFLFFSVIPLGANAAWYNTNYQYCRVLTMTAGGNSGGVATTTTAGFALVATSTLSTLAATSSAGHIYETGTNNHGTTTPVDVAVTSGSDCNSAGSLLDFYFERYVPTTGQFVLWVEPTDISSTSAKTVLMYYGYADNSATDVSNEAGVFGSLDEISVWNLSEDPSTAGAGGVKDSLAANNGTPTGTFVSSDAVAGQIGDGVQFNGTDSYISIGSAASLKLSKGTVLFWVSTPYSTAGQSYVSRYRTTSGGNLYYEVRSSTDATNGNKFRIASYTPFTSVYTQSAVSENAWFETGFSFDGTTQQVFKNGALDNSSAVANVMTDNSANFLIGAKGTSSVNGFAAGKIDDVRVYSRVLDPMDILTIYNNTNSSGTFWTFGAEQSQAVSAVRIIRLSGGVRLRGIRLK